MKAMQLVAPATLEYVEVERPSNDAVGPGEVLVRVLAGGICGSDLPNFKGRLSLWFGDRAAGATTIPGYPLHEIVGEALVTNHPSVAVGDRVVGWATRLTGLAQYTITSGDSINRYDRQLRPTEAILLQPLACVLFTLDQLNIPGRRAAVIGLGPIGLLFCHALNAAGAAQVIGVDPIERDQEASIFRIDTLVRSTSDRWAANLEPEDRPEIVIDAVGHQQATLHDAVSAVAEGGTIFDFGVSDEAVVTFPLDAFQRKNLTLVAAGARNRRHWLAQADAYAVAHPEVLASVTDVLPFDRAQDAFELAMRPARRRLKVVLDMT